MLPEQISIKSDVTHWNVYCW